MNISKVLIDLNLTGDNSCIALQGLQIVVKEMGTLVLYNIFKVAKNNI